MIAMPALSVSIGRTLRQKPGRPRWLLLTCGLLAWVASLVTVTSLAAVTKEAAVTSAATATREAAVTTEAAALLEDDGVMLVRTHCTGCHAVELVTSQRGDREFWLNIIRWMQNTQNLWPLPAQQEQQMLDYLAKNYNESEWGRRPPLSVGLLPNASSQLSAQPLQ